MTELQFPRPLAVFRGAVTCQCASNLLILSGPAGDSEEGVILTFITASSDGVPDTLTAPEVLALAEDHYRIRSAARSWDIRATSVHVHRDIGNAFYRAIPPRPAPLKKRLFWRVVLGLAGTRAGKRLLLFLRGR